MSTDHSESVPQEAIAARAYERYLERGGENGHDVEDWLAAEAELRIEPPDRASSTPKSGSSPTTKKPKTSRV